MDTVDQLIEYAMRPYRDLPRAADDPVFYEAKHNLRDNLAPLAPVLIEILPEQVTVVLTGGEVRQYAGAKTAG